VEQAVIDALDAWRAGRDTPEAEEALWEFRDAAKSDINLMAATLRCARGGVTTGEWSGALREVFGEDRAPNKSTRSVASRSSFLTRRCSPVVP
jgi:(2R)-ethylmalonyl-CoA mutase